MGADDTADLADQQVFLLQVVAQVGLDGRHLTGGDGVTGQRREGGVDAAHLLDLLEQGHVGAGQAAGLAGHGDLAVLDGDKGLDAQHPACNGYGSGQAAALAQVLQVVDSSHKVQVLLGVFQNGGDLTGRFAGIPQLDGQANEQGFAQADVSAVHKEDVVHIGHVSGQLGALVGAGQRVGQEDADDLVPGGSSFEEEVLEQFRAGLAGGGQLAAPGQDLIIGGGGHVHAIPQDGAVLQRDVQGDDGHAQLLGFGGQDVGRRIGENTDHKYNTSEGRGRKTTNSSEKSWELYQMQREKVNCLSKNFFAFSQNSSAACANGGGCGTMSADGRAVRERKTGNGRVLENVRSGGAALGGTGSGV